MTSELEELKKLTKTLTRNGYLTDQTAAWKYAFNSVKDLVCITNTLYEIKFLNTPFLQKMSIKDKSYINKNINSFFSKEIVVNNTSSLIKNGNIIDSSDEIFLQELNGWFIKYQYIIKNKTGDVIGYTFMFVDVTERKRVEARLSASEARFRNLFNYMTVPAIIFEAILEGDDFVVVGVNKIAENMIGFELKDILDKRLSKLIEHAFLLDCLDDLKKVFITGEPIDKPTTYYDTKGWLNIFIFKPSSCDVVLLYTDETNRIESKLNLKSSNDLLEGVLNNIPDIIGVQGPDGELLKYNAAGLSYFNVTEEDIIGKKCYNLLGRDSRCEECQTILCKETKKPTKRVRYIEELGTWFDCRSYPILDDDGNVIKVIEHLRDITDIKTEQFKKEAYLHRMNYVMNRLDFVVTAIDGYIWEKRSNPNDQNGPFIYTYISPKFCKDIYNTDTIICPEVDSLYYYDESGGIYGKSSRELLDHFTNAGKMHTLGNLFNLTDKHCMEQGKPCDYIEMGYIEKVLGSPKWFILKVRKTPVFVEGVCISVLGFANNYSFAAKSLKILIERGLFDGHIVKLETGANNSKVYWVNSGSDTQEQLTHLDFP